MSTWNPDELARVGRAEELRISSTRPDGTDRPFVIIWTVRAGDSLYVRSAGGPTTPGSAVRCAPASVASRPAVSAARNLHARRRDDITTQAAVDAATTQVRPIRAAHRRLRRRQARPPGTLRIAPADRRNLHDRLTLNNGVTLPAIGLGVFQSPPEETAAAVRPPCASDTGTSTPRPRTATNARSAKGSGAPAWTGTTCSSRRRCGSPTTGTTRRCTRSRRPPASSASTPSTC